MPNTIARSPYFAEIRESLARQGFVRTNPRLVEAWMRTEYPTLDALTRSQFDLEVLNGALCVQADPRGSEELASALGL